MQFFLKEIHTEVLLIYDNQNRMIDKCLMAGTVSGGFFAKICNKFWWRVAAGPVHPPAIYPPPTPQRRKTEFPDFSWFYERIRVKLCFVVCSTVWCSAGNKDPTDSATQCKIINEKHFAGSLQRLAWVQNGVLSRHHFYNNDLQDKTLIPSKPFSSLCIAKNGSTKTALLF